MIFSCQLRRSFHLNALFLLFFLSSTSLPAQPFVDRIVAVVNDDIITQSELDRETARLEARLSRSGETLPPRKVLEKQILSQMIDQKLQLQRAKALGLRVDDVSLEQTLRRIMEDSGVSTDDFIAQAQAEGYSFAEFREELRKEILLNNLLQSTLGERIIIADQEIAMLRSGQARDNSEYRLRHIMIGINDSSNAAEVAKGRAKAEALRQQLVQGADFARLAITESQGPQALQGGDLGFRRREEIPTLFLPVLDTLQKGQVSAILENSSGFHLVYLEDKRGENSPIQYLVRARHILVRGSKAKSTLETLKKRLERGEPFATLAQQFSEDPDSKNRGGDLGWLLLNEAPATFAKPLMTASKGERLIYESQFGWHLVEILDRRQQEVKPLSKTEARLLLQERKLEEERALWLKQLRSESYIENRLETL
jgi:peptidyl-prolyl cis-trans isomerase SurA